VSAAIERERERERASGGSCFSLGRFLPGAMVTDDLKTRTPRKTIYSVRLLESKERATSKKPKTIKLMLARALGRDCDAE
jgi:hypothetical protein